MFLMLYANSYQIGSIFLIGVKNNKKSFKRDKLA